MPTMAAAAASSSVGWYVAFGAAHEASHVAAAAIVGRIDGAGGYLNVARALFGRHVRLPSLAAPDCPRWHVDFVQHFAWVCSVALAVAAFALTRTKNKNDSKNRSEAAAAMVLAAIVTALEAIASDLLRWGPSGSAGSSSFYDFGGGDKAMAQTSLFFCGNFGEETETRERGRRGAGRDGGE